MLTIAPLLAPIPGPHDETDRLAEEIAELAVHIEVASARLLVLIREFDARGGWAAQGARSCAHWLTWRLNLDPGTARERVRVARALGVLPKLAAALDRGELSYAKVRALTRVATPETEDRLLGVGRSGTAAHVERIVRGWRRVDRAAEVREAGQRHARRSLRVYHDEGGMVVIRGRLEPEIGAVLLKALEAAREALHQRGRRAAGAPANAPAGAAACPETSHDVPAETPPAAWAPEPPDPTGDPPTAGQRQADALALVCETALHQGLDPGPAAERYQIVVHVDAAVLAEPNQCGQSLLEDGPHVPAETSRRLACDASRVVLRHDAEGRTVEVGHRTRTIPPALRRALLHRDRGCRFPGCGSRFTQGHHLQHWANGGPTTLSNLALLCRFHHRAVHEAGFQAERAPDGTLAFRRPDGRLIPDLPPPPTAIPADPLGALRAHHAARGLHLTALTALPNWDGQPLDLGWAIDVLHPLANPGG